MKAPRNFIISKRKGYSPCMGCGKWKEHNNIFHHEGKHWILCKDDYFDYWENTDVLSPDYKAYNV